MAWQLCCFSLSSALQQSKGSVCDASWSCRAVYDYQFTNSEGCVFNKLVFLNWCAAPVWWTRIRLWLARAELSHKDNCLVGCPQAHAQSLRSYIPDQPCCSPLPFSLFVCPALH